MTPDHELHRTKWDRRRGRGQTRPEQAAERLAARAMSAQPGERLGTKDELRGTCGVSVGTFNEALRMVQSRGLVTVRSGPGGGLFAAEQSPMVRMGNAMLNLGDEDASVADAFRLRHALDPLLIEDALEHASAHDIGALRTELDTMIGATDSGDCAAFIRADSALHARIAEISPSIMLRSFYLNLLEITEAGVLAVVHENEQLIEWLLGRCGLHVDLVNAIAQRDRRALDVLQELNTGAPSVIEAISASAP